jgi:hypothetical protein
MHWTPAKVLTPGRGLSCSRKGSLTALPDNDEASTPHIDVSNEMTTVSCVVIDTVGNQKNQYRALLLSRHLW